MAQSHRVGEGEIEREREREREGLAGQAKSEPLFKEKGRSVGIGLNMYQ